MFKDMEMTKQKEIIQTYKIFGRCYEKMCKNKRVRQIFEMGSENADNTIEENDKWKVGSKTYSALLLYSFHDPKQHNKEDELSKNGFQMANELDMNRSTDRDKPKTFYEKTSDEGTKEPCWATLIGQQTNNVIPFFEKVICDWPINLGGHVCPYNSN